MKASPMMLALLTCGMLSFTAGAVESAQDGKLANDPVKAADPSTIRRDANPLADRARGGAPARAGASRSAAWKPRDAAAASRPGLSITQSHRIALNPQSNADKLRSLLNAQSHRRIPRQSARSVSPRGISGGAPGIRAPFGAGSASTAGLVASTRAATPAPLHSSLGGSQLQGPARMDGRAFTKTTRSSTIDGSQLQLTRHRKS